MPKPPEIHTVAVAAKGPDCAELVRGLLRRLEDDGLEVRLDEDASRASGNGDGLPRARAVEGADLVFSVGGDGTLLSVARAVGAAETPILGINLGSLGFLTETDVQHLEDILDDVLRGSAPVETRLALEVERSGPEGRAPAGTALNDLVVSTAPVRLLRFALELNQAALTDYRGDGLIVATATGSTAYSLSAGGPIVDPSLDALLITPICPHSLANRPLVVPADAEVSVRLLEGTGEAFATLDGQQGFPVGPGEVLRITRAAHRVHLVRPVRRDFYALLREKMGWGNP